MNQEKNECIQCSIHNCVHHAGTADYCTLAPGAELERDIYPLMGFRPAVAADLKEMDPRIFRPEKMGLVLQD